MSEVGRRKPGEKLNVTVYRDRGKRRMGFFFYGHGDHRALHSFPTRRSSDLARGRVRPVRPGGPDTGARHPRPPRRQVERWEEHTSELQSREKLVCRLLLE